MAHPGARSMTFSRKFLMTHPIACSRHSQVKIHRTSSKDALHDSSSCLLRTLQRTNAQDTSKDALHDSGKKGRRARGRRTLFVQLSGFSGGKTKVVGG